MVFIGLDDTQYTYLIQLLNERFYSITDLKELATINSIYKQMNFKAESWLQVENKKEGGLKLCEY